MLRRSWRFARYTTSSNEIPRLSETPLHGIPPNWFLQADLYKSRNLPIRTAPPRPPRRRGSLRFAAQKVLKYGQHAIRDESGSNQGQKIVGKVSSDVIELASIAPKSGNSSTESARALESVYEDIRPGLGGSEECLCGGLQSSLPGPATPDLIVFSSQNDKHLGIAVPQTVLRERLYRRRPRKATALALPLRGRKAPAKAPVTRYNNTPYRNISLRPHNSSHGGSEGRPLVLQKFAKFDSRWFDAFSIINAIHRPDLPAPDIKVPSSVLRISSFVRRVQRRIKTRSLLVTVRKLWISQNIRWKRIWWQPTLLYCLLKSPLNALRIAEEVCTKRYLPVPSYMLSDVLDHVVSTEVENVPEPTRLTIDLLLNSISLYLKRYACGGPAHLLHQRSICVLSKHCDAIQLDRFAKTLQESECVVETDSQLHIMTRYVQVDELGQALEVLRTIPASHYRLEALQSVCSLILRAPWKVEDLYGLRCRILSFMLELGISPNKYLRNVIILNAMEAGDRAMAWQSYAMMKRNGLLPDSFTYSILLKGVEHGDDLSTINSIYQESKLDGTLMNSPYLASHMLWTIYLFHQQRKQPAFNAMVSFYTEAFDVAPLYDLGLLDKGKQLQSRDRIFMTPTQRALGWLLIAWLRDNSRNQARLHEVYDRYLEHTINGHSVIGPLASQTFVTAFFIIAFGESRSSLQMCTTIAQNLIRPPRSTAAPTGPPSHESISDASSPTDNTKAAAGEQLATVDKPSPSSEVSTSHLAQEDSIASTPTLEAPAPAQQSTEESSTSSDLASEENPTANPPASSSPTSSDTKIFYDQTPFVPFALPQPPTKEDLYPIAPPDINVWNALLVVFARHKQLRAAERIMKLMRLQNIKPNKASWDSLVYGYAHLQDPGKVVTTVERMAKENYRPDEWTMRFLSRVHDRRGLLERFKQAAEMEREREVEKEEEEKRRREEWMEYVGVGEEDGESEVVVKERYEGGEVVAPREELEEGEGEKQELEGMEQQVEERKEIATLVSGDLGSVR
ncbi:hypothetical protein MMC10_000304 [Thelotrema lepadinum]|nr:hypothetical protein [Thelotrema lepadinum]